MQLLHAERGEGKAAAGRERVAIGQRIAEGGEEEADRSAYVCGLLGRLGVSFPVPSLHLPCTFPAPSLHVCGLLGRLGVCDGGKLLHCGPLRLARVSYHRACRGVRRRGQCPQQADQPAEG
jgi:hypothetical protein